ncbi:MAG: iron-containing alcohol dehydrogenase [Planctomycetia bacterium]|nr:iron-containing alcohol dehydrogenase [Planctomycetia bacterium]
MTESYPTLAAMDYQPRTRIVFGAGRIVELGTLAAELGARRALVVSDPGVVAAGHTQHGIESLRAAGIGAELFQDVHENPTTDDVEKGLVFAQCVAPDLIVAIGGGSSMDCAKGINFLHTNGGAMQDYWGRNKARRALLPMIGVPTTSGTGSEAQSYALISDAATHVKMACGDPKAAFRVALLDPELTLTQPARVTALTGIDAISHALETYVTTAATPVSRAMSREAWTLLWENFTRVLVEPTRLYPRGRMQLGACFAGLAIENSMLGAAHALANPLTARYGIVHGQAIALMLPHVLRFNARDVWHLYGELVRLVVPDHRADDSTTEGGAAEFLAKTISGWTTYSGLADRLSTLNIPRNELDSLAADAAQQWTANFNPRRVGKDELLGLYEAAY